MPSADSAHSVASSGLGSPVVWSTPTSPSRICRVIRVDSTSLASAGSRPRGCEAVPNVNDSEGAAGDAVAVLAATDDGAGRASLVQEVRDRPRNAAPALMAVRRGILLLGIRLPPLDCWGALGGCLPGTQSS